MLSLLLAGLLVSSVWASALPEAEARRGRKEKTIHVSSGGSIQAALNFAPRGSRIVVDRGTYNENLLITTDGITLVGNGATLAPPEYPEFFSDNNCTGFAGPINPGVDEMPTQAGICVAGGGLDLADFAGEHRRVTSVRVPVKDVSITGFTVSGFSGFNILVVGGENVNVYGNTLLDGPKYGFLTAGSRNTRVSDNKISWTTPPGLGFIGICMDDISKVKISKNKISSYYIGLCIQTNGAELEENEVGDACYGAFFDPGVKDVRFRDNKMIRAHPNCAPYGASGIVLDGAIGARVENNLVKGWKTDDPKTSGIDVVDDPCSGPLVGIACQTLDHPAVARDNLIKGNMLHNNTLDIFNGTVGAGNEFKKNDCDTSNLKRVCRKTILIV